MWRATSHRGRGIAALRRKGRQGGAEKRRAFYPACPARDSATPGRPQPNAILRAPFHHRNDQMRAAVRTTVFALALAVAGAAHADPKQEILATHEAMVKAGRFHSEGTATW
jgi:hypothetical protein